MKEFDEDFCKKCPQVKYLGKTCCGYCSKNFGYYHVPWKSDFKYGPETISDQTSVALKKFEFFKGDVKELLSVLRAEWGDTVQWDNTTGFLGQLGCTIPRQFRSRICLNFKCGSLQEHLKGLDVNANNGKLIP
jgi:hypothetical protein